MIDLPVDPRIVGDGVVLRRWRIDDIDPLVEIWPDPELRRRFAVPATTTPTIEVFVRDAGRSWTAGAGCMLAVVDPVTDEILGGCDLSGLDRDGPADVGYWVAAGHRREGVAVRAVSALLDWAAHDLGLHAFALELEPDNSASIAVATALGFAPDGTERRDRSVTPARTLVRYQRPERDQVSQRDPMGRELVALGLAFLLAGLLGGAGRRVGLPTIPLFMLAGILAGPFTPGPVLFGHPEDLELLAAFGLIFLLFYLGVEFSLDQLTEGGARLFASAAIYLALNIGAGLALGFAIGWGTEEALVIAGATGVSSSAIVTKLLVELRRLDNPETKLILGIIVLEDLFLALYLAALAPVLGGADSAGDAVLLFARAAGFLIVLGLAARSGGRWIGKVIEGRDDELLVILCVGFALLVAGIAFELGVSDAIGAFMAGVVLASTAAAKQIERLVTPLRDAFAALFFFAFGLSIDPGDIGRVAAPALVAIAMSVVLAFVAGVVTARINGLDRLAATNVACSVLARGEFALILVALATQAGLDERLTPFVAEYVLVLAIASPIMASQSARISRLFPRRWFAEPVAG